MMNPLVLQAIEAIKAKMGGGVFSKIPVEAARTILGSPNPAPAMAPPMPGRSDITVPFDGGQQNDFQKLVEAARRRVGEGHLYNALGPMMGAVVHTPNGVTQLRGAEGLGNAAIASGTRDLDRMSPGERGYVEDQVPGLQLPQDMTREDYRTGPLGKLQWFDPKTQGVTESRERVGAMNEEGRNLRQDKALTAADARAGRRNEIMERALELRKQVLDLSTQRFGFQRQHAADIDRRFWARLQMPNGEPYSRITDLTKAKTVGERFLANYNPNNFGAIQGRFNDFMQWLGVEPAEYASDNAIRMQVNAQYLFGLGGKALTGTELAQLSPTLPQLMQNPDAFRVTLHQLLAKINSDLTTELESQARIGKNVTGLADLADVDLSEGAMSFMDQFGPAATAAPAPAAPSAQGQQTTGGTVIMVNPTTGTEFPIPANRVAEFRDKGLQEKK